jgi:microsomal dipeptidase-like Zn-dependent dipeptidase
MHLPVDDEPPPRTHDRARRMWRLRWQGMVVELISRLFNYQGPGDTPSVTQQLMRKGNVGVVLSMLYWPFDEMDLDESYGAPPREAYFDDIVAQHRTVEKYVADHPHDLVIAHSPKELDAHIGKDIPILIHAIEGGFQAGHDAAQIKRNVAKLAALGVAYITVAHLFFREVATNAPALPFLPDRVYNWAFPQDVPDGLTARGHALVEAMIDEGILIDITHMREDSIKAVFELLEKRDPKQEIPVIATHMACRLGGLEYCLDDDTITEVAKRDGVLGLILCEHYITSGLTGIDKTFEGSVEALCKHIDKIHDLTGGYDHIAIGSDLDGYIKPALPGLEHMGKMAALQQELESRYGQQVAEKISSGNALRVLRDHWGRKRR